MDLPHYDVLIIGAGLSGIGMACQLAKECPTKRVTIIERRESLGGTWDLFRYPGIRSDSDMFTFGFGFRPWRSLKVLADGPSIRNYLAETAREFGVENKIQYGLKVQRADWSSARGRWTLTALHEKTGETREITARFVVMGTGYYNYDKGHQPDFPNIDQFKGQVIHPQFWPENLEYTGKRVVVIGSGATAVTLVPSMADKAAHVTMLQRSPSYVFSLPNYDKITEVLQRFLPESWTHRITRMRNLKFYRMSYKLSQRYPKTMRKVLMNGVKKKVGPDFDMTHFNPRYNPWDERLCAVPDSDLFIALRNRKASIVTDHIDTFVPEGIRLKSGKVLEADIIITATGLQLQTFGGMEVRVDGVAQQVEQKKMYKAVLLEDLPNLAAIVGYTNLSWTMKADLSAAYVCRLLKHMDKKKVGVAIPVDREGCTLEESIFGSLRSGYIQRGKTNIMRQGSKAPWVVTHNYELDRPMLLDEPVADGILQFTKAGEPVAKVTAPLQRAA